MSNEDNFEAFGANSIAIFTHLAPIKFQ